MVKLSEFFPGQSEMARRMREFDWSKTPLGPVDSWSPALRTMLRILLANRFPHILWWGPHYIQFYNDPYIPIPGAKHPDTALGQPASQCWPEIWHIIGPLIDTPFSGGPATWNEDIFLELNRHGFLEETHFTIAYSPVPDETAASGIGGVLATVHEISEKVVGERRMIVLQDLGTKASEAKTADEACAAAAETLARHSKDIPFALVYLVDAGGKHARLASVAGVAKGGPASPPILLLGDQGGKAGAWPLAVRAQTIQIVEDLEERFGDAVPPGPWSDPPRQAVVVPIRSNIAHNLAGLLVMGVSARLRLDDLYCSFFELVAGQIATAIANARAYEEERKRAEALAQIDRAKTVFFSNVSHEFRTPLTLILGPVEEMLSSTAGETNEIQRAHLTTLRHNVGRLQKLVNTLLDFARVEAGRIEATYEPVDIGLLTRDLASTFCSAVHRAGILYVVNCPSIDEPVYIDRDMWEKIVLNLLSNALKFTFTGAIEVSLREAGERRIESGEKAEPLVTDHSPRTAHLVLTVRDTGVGIPEEEVPRLFTRFQRIHRSHARTQEGSGIGLALVHELVKLHGGSIRVESAVDQGTTFTVSIPKGIAHLPKERLSAPRTLSSTALGAEPFVEEALRWLPDSQNEGEGIKDEIGREQTGIFSIHRPSFMAHSSEPLRRILVADDNSEMRNYLKRLLETNWQVTAVEDGARALEVALTERPDLVLSDVMMPGLDGFELLRKLRDNDNTSSIPVILLSARAGEEAYIEGMSAGADDYIVKPFGARELIARVKALLEVTRVRRESERRVINILESITDGFQVIDKDWRLTYMNSEAKRTLAEHGIDPEWAIGKHFWNELFPEMADTEIAIELRRAMTERVPVVVENYYSPWNSWYSNRIYPLPEGGLANYFHDITNRKVAEEALREHQKQLNAELAATQQLQETSTRLIGEDVVEVLYEHILAAAVVIMSADYASVQMFYPGAGAGGELRLLGHRGFSTEAASFWEWVRPDSESTCGVALRTGQRVIVPDVQACDFMAGSRDLKTYLQSGIHAVQTTPLVSRDGQLVGMISTHWRQPHQPSERDLRLLDVLARQAADLIERSKAEEALRKSEGRFRTMADSSPSIIWLSDVAGNLIFVNRAYAEFSNVSLDDLPGFDWRQILHPEDRDRYIEAFNAALREPRPFHERARARRRDGEWRWLESCGAPIFDQSGTLTGYIGSSLDITGIYESQQKLKELDQRKDEFLANMSHEIRSPLTGIMGYADILLSKLRDPEDIAFLNTIKESGEYLIEIVNDILDLSKIEAGKLVLNIEAVSVHAVLAEVHGLMNGRARQKNLPLTLRFESVLPESVQTDRTRLRQILINLVSNAIKFTERGRVEIVAKSIDGVLAVEVIDTGIGIAPEHQEILFQPFTQADATSTRGYGGTGLGLTITRRLLEMLGGSISFESELGKGSTFRVTIPVGPRPREGRKAPAAVRVSPEDDSFPLRDLHVLTVDDREEFCYLVSRYVQDAGGRATAVYDGQSAIEALEKAKTDPFHAVIMDIQMPGMDGYEATRRLRVKGFQTPIIALTAGAMVGDREKCMAAGCDDYLSKPIDRRALVATVARHAQKMLDRLSGKLKVLVVDDSHGACELLRRYLERRGHEVCSAHDGESALRVAQQFRPDVIVLDIRLPDINGHELMQRLKEVDGIRRARFIGVSGYYDPSSQSATEFDHFLEKPLDMTQLERLLESSASVTWQ